jgi:hypothetical protein
VVLTGIQFFLAYRSLCPSAWCERWDDQRGKAPQHGLLDWLETDNVRQQTEPSPLVWISKGWAKMNNLGRGEWSRFH